MKELQSFKLNFEKKRFFGINNLIFLYDGRILVVDNDTINNKSQIYVFDITNDNICDIYFILSNIFSIGNIFNMKDGNIILYIHEININYMKIFQVKKKYFEEIYYVDNLEGHCYQLLKEKFIFCFGEVKKKYVIYSYKNNKLIQDSFFEYNYERFPNILKICSINEKEIVIYFYKYGMIYGENAYLQFYNIKSDYNIKILKLGNFERGSEMIYMNENNLVVELNNKLLLIDTKNKNIQKILKLDIDYYYEFEMIFLNNTTFLIIIDDKIYQYEIKDSQIFFIGISEFKSSFVLKYPNNKIMLYGGAKDGGTIFICGM